MSNRSKTYKSDDKKVVAAYNRWKKGESISILADELESNLKKHFKVLAKKIDKSTFERMLDARPKVSAKEKALEHKRAHLAKKGIAVPKIKEKSDKELLEEMKERFMVFERMTVACTKGQVPSLVVPGAPGIGKSYTVAKVMGQTGAKHIAISGTMSPIGLYMTGYQYRNKGDVIIIDDADKALKDEESINILKALTDSKHVREISWKKDSETLREENVEASYVFEGSVILLSNIDFQEYVDLGRGRGAEHMGAIISRALYLDLRIYDRRTLNIWINHVCRDGKMFEVEGVDSKTGERILNWLHANQSGLREYSLRTVHKLCNLVRLDKEYGTDLWEADARVTLCR